MELKIKKLHPDAILPTYATPGSACFDLHSMDTAFIAANSAGDIDTGLAFEIPENHAMLIFSRSGHGFKHGVRLGNAVGVGDADFRGSLRVCLRNDGRLVFGVNAGDRIAQAMVIPVEQVTFKEVSELSETVRGENGFGSTGV